MLKFEWGDGKALVNLRKHGVSFEEATSIFGDALSYTFPDPDHSVREARYLTLGLSHDHRLLIVAHAERARAISARKATRHERTIMSKADDTLRTHYRREDLGAGVRGKYFKRYSKGTNVVLLDDRVVRAFPTSEAVNDALLGLLALAEKAKPAARASRKRTTS